MLHQEKNFKARCCGLQQIAANRTVAAGGYN